MTENQGNIQVSGVNGVKDGVCLERYDTTPECILPRKTNEFFSPPPSLPPSAVAVSQDVNGHLQGIKNECKLFVYPSSLILRTGTK